MLAARRAPLDRHPRGRRHGARRRRGGPAVRRRLKLPPPVVTATAATAPVRAVRPVPALARARRRRRACCRCGPTSPPTRCPTTIPRRSSGGCGSPIRCAPTACSAAARRRRCASSARSAAAARFRAWEKVLVWSHWVWFLFPHGTVAVPAAAPPRALPARRGADLRDVRPRADRLLGDPDRAALVRRAAGPDGGRPHAGAAAHDGRVRRAVLEVRLGALCTVSSGEIRWPPCRPCTSPHPSWPRTCSPRPAAPPASLGWAYAGTLGIALVYLGEHYVVDLAAGLALAEGVRAARRRRRRLARALSRGRAGARGAGARMSGGPAAPVAAGRTPEPPEDDDDERPRAPAHAAQRARARRLPARLDRRAVLPAAAARRPRRHVAPDRGRQPVLAAPGAAVHRRDVRRLRGACSAASSCAPGGARIGWRESYQITMAGLAASRMFAAGGAGGLVLHGLGAAARRACASAWSPTRRSRFLILTYFPYAVAVDRLRLRPALRAVPRRGPVRAHRRAGRRSARDRARHRARRSRSCRPTSSAGSSGSAARRRPARAGSRSSSRNAPASASAGMRDALEHLRSRDPALLGAFAVLGASRSSSCGRRSARSATRRRSPCSCRRSSSACSATCCRCRAASAASRAA